MGDGLTFMTAPMTMYPTEITFPIAANSFFLVLDERADLFLIVRLSRRTSKKWWFMGRSIPTPHREAGCGLAPQARQEAQPALPPLSHPNPRQEAAAQGRRRGVRNSHI